MKQSAVKWLVKHLCDRSYIQAPSFGHSIIDKAIEQAKEMEKQQIVDAFNQGERYGWESKDSIGNLEEMKRKIPLISLEELLEQFKNK